MRENEKLYSKNKIFLSKFNVFKLKYKKLSKQYDIPH